MRDRVVKSAGERIVNLHDLQTRERMGWYILGTRARHCIAMSFGRPGISCDDGSSMLLRSAIDRKRERLPARKLSNGRMNGLNSQGFLDCVLKHPNDSCFLPFIK